MGGYYSGRKASNKPNIDDLYSLDVCQLYRDKGLVGGNANIVRYTGGYYLTVFCLKAPSNTQLELAITYDVLCNGTLRSLRQVVMVEWLDVLNGRARRPYFICPQSGRYASKLYLGHKGFAHRTCCGLIYRIQRLGHFDRAFESLRSIKARLKSNDADAATDPPSRPKGMHKQTYQKHLTKHYRLAAPILEKLEGFYE